MALALLSTTPGLPGDEGASPAVEASVLPPLASELGRLYEQHFPMVWRTLRRLGLGVTQAEDAAQDVFLVAHRRLGDFEGRSSESTWLVGIALRVAHQHRRRGVRSPLQEPAQLELVASDARGPDGEMEAARARDTLYALLQQLSEPLRDAFVLLELEELSGREAALWLGVPENTVYSRLRLAKERMRTALCALQRADGAARKRADHG
jgi:RNA polymerase sigma-70 factor (ECF subfamily)